jgi:hypothetical protein
MKTITIIISIVIVLSCLILGYFLGNSTVPTLTPTPSSSLSQSQGNGQTDSTSTAESAFLDSALLTNPDQHNLILIQADDLTNPDPRLISIWLLGYLIDSPKISLILIYPVNSDADQTKIEELSDSFRVDADGELSLGFLTSLGTMGFQSNGYILTDEIGTKVLIDEIGGIDLQNGSGVVSGTEALSVSIPPWEDITSAINYQKVVAQGICNRMDRVSEKTNLFIFVMDLLPDHFRSDVSLEFAAQDWEQISSFGGDLSCNIILP